MVDPYHNQLVLSYNPDVRSTRLHGNIFFDKTEDITTGPHCTIETVVNLDVIVGSVTYSNFVSGAREWPFYHSLEFIRLSMSEPWPSDKLMRCEKCSFTTNRGDKMTLHKKSKHWNNGNKKKYMCHECGFKAFSQIFLNDHINVVHLNKKLHNCDQCDYTTGWTSSLVTHKKIHQPDHIGRSGALGDQRM